METAALALDLGWADPMALLSLPRRDYKIALAIITKAQEIRSKRYRQLVDVASKIMGAK